jgi:Protein of unknown function (DUF2380)
MRTVLAGLLLLAAPAAADDLWQGETAAFFGVVFLDTSLEGELNGLRPDETARVKLVGDYLADAFAARGLALVDLAPVQAELDLIANPADCFGCDARMAGRLGARYAIVSEVQKVSNLILSMNVVVRDAATGATVRGMAADIRSNTDESWLRGMRYILENGIFREG